MPPTPLHESLLEAESALTRLAHAPLQCYSGRAALLARPARPPPYGCFTLPEFQLLPALEALMGLLFANLFWVGLWDLLDNTIFPDENSIQMLSLVRERPCVPWPRRARRAVRVCL